MTARRLTGALVATALLAAGCGEGDAIRVAGGDPERGAAAIDTYGCGGCHSIPGDRGLDGRIGPSLADLTERRYIAGSVPNRADGLARFIRNPRSINPGTLMPNLGVSRRDALDIAAYLYSEP